MHRQVFCKNMTFFGALSLLITLVCGEGRQPAKKVVSDSPGLVNSVFNLPNGQVIFFEEFE